MKIAHRLYLTVVPAVLGLVTVAALAYWGQYAYTVPRLVLAVAAAGAVITLVLGWANVRYVAQRVERLAGVENAAKPAMSLRGVASAVVPGSVPSEPDELDAIEVVVDRLSNAVTIAESERVEGERLSLEQARDYAIMLASAAEGATKKLDEVRLPLHILLENHFGDLNENQEEMIGAARAAAEVADVELSALRQIAELDSGARILRRDRIVTGDLVRALAPTLQAIAEKHESTLRLDVEPLIPAMRGDRPQLQTALSALLGAAIGAAAARSEIDLRVRRTGGTVELTLLGAGEVARNVTVTLASRIIAAAGGRLAHDGRMLCITFPTTP